MMNGDTFPVLCPTGTWNVFPSACFALERRAPPLPNRGRVYCPIRTIRHACGAKGATIVLPA